VDTLGQIVIVRQTLEQQIEETVDKAETIMLQMHQVVLAVKVLSS
jgi:hypothetical protein